MEKSLFICPICGDKLNCNNKTMQCLNNHSFDKSKSGYVNLLMSQQSKSKNHGDDKLMVNARKSFLEKDYYKPLADKLCTVTEKCAQQNSVILDAGCGECYYTNAIQGYLKSSGFCGTVGAVDISKNALALGGKKNKEISLAVASVYNLPVADNSVDILLTIFSPYCAEEYTRVLKNGGIMIMVIPLDNHLLQLKRAVYESAYENKVKDFNLQNFDLAEKLEIKYTINIENNIDIKNLFSMTPYYYKTSEADQQKLNNIDKLTTEVEFGILVYKKQ